MLLCSLLQGKAQTWDTIIGMALNARTYCFIDFHDTLILAGNYSNGMPLTNSNSVIGWDGINVYSYPGNIQSTPAKALGLYNGRLYIGGSFDDITNPDDISKLAVWNGTEWERVGTAVVGAGTIYYFQVYRDTLYIGGNYGINFNSINDGYLVKWNDTAFYSCSTYGSASFGTHPTGIAVYNDALYAGLYSCFSVGGGQYVCSLGKYNGQTWANVYDKNGNQFQSGVSSLLTDTINNDLYIAGISVFRYDGESFHLIGTAGSQVNGHAMQMYHGDLYIGGMFSQVDGIPANHLAKWDGEQWSEPEGGVSNSIESMYVYKDELYVGGYFDSVGGYLPAYGVARYYEPAAEDCHWFRPRIQTAGYQDTFYITQSQPYIFIDFVNNNAYAESWEWDFGDGFNGSGSKDIEHGYYQPGEYTVQVEVTQDGCTKIAEKLIVIEDHTGGVANKAGTGAITVYPNPGSGLVVIKTNNGSAIGRIRISSTLGKQMYKAEISNPEISIDISQWNAGTYLVECKEHGVMKLVVE